MANARAALKQSDLTRYAKALLAAGIEEFRVEVKPDGTHVIVAAAGRSGSSGNDWD